MYSQKGWLGYQQHSSTTPRPAPRRWMGPPQSGPCSGALTVGHYGNGTLQVTNGATVISSGGTICNDRTLFIAAHGAATVSGGSLVGPTGRRRHVDQPLIVGTEYCGRACRHLRVAAGANRRRPGRHRHGPRNYYRTGQHHRTGQHGDGRRRRLSVEHDRRKHHPRQQRRHRTVSAG